MSKRWTLVENAAWIAFFRGETIEPPEGRDINVARRRFAIPAIGDLHPSVLHAMATAAAQYLPRIAYRRQGCHARFIEAVQIRAVHPDAVEGWGYPKNVFDAAVRDARRAMCDAPDVEDVEASVEQLELSA